MIVVVHRHADVVEHARRPQQLALDRIAIVQSRLGQLVEEPQRQPPDVFDVLGVDREPRREVDHAGKAHVVEQRRVGGREIGLEEDALAQPRLGDLHPVDAGHRRLVGVLDGVEAAELPRERLRCGRSDVPDRQRHQHPPQRDVLAALQVGQQLRAVGRERAVLLREVDREA